MRVRKKKSLQTDSVYGRWDFGVPGTSVADASTWLGFCGFAKILVKFFPLLVCVREEVSGTRHGGGCGVSAEVMRARYK